MAGEGVRIIGLSEFSAAMDKMIASVEAGTSAAVVEGAHAIEAAAKKRATGPARWRKGQNFPREGGPGVVTGTLRRSITVVGPLRTGIGGYRALVGPTAVYGRAIELGHPRWHRSGGYPYMAPGLSDALSGPLTAIFERRWAGAIRR